MFIPSSPTPFQAERGPVSRKQLSDFRNVDPSDFVREDNSFFSEMLSDAVSLSLRLKLPTSELVIQNGAESAFLCTQKQKLKRLVLIPFVGLSFLLHPSKHTSVTYERAKIAWNPDVPVSNRPVSTRWWSCRPPCLLMIGSSSTRGVKPTPPKYVPYT